MGIASDGILYFGFPVGEDEELPEWMGDFDDFDDFVVAKVGIDPDAPYEQRSPAIKACPAELQRYCSYEYSMYILGIRDAEYRVNRGYTEEITPENLIVPQEKIAAFKAWCEANGIEYQEPKWLLCSMYG